MRRPKKKKIVEKTAEGIASADHSIPAEPSSPDKAQSAPAAADGANPPETPSKRELAAADSLVRSLAQQEAAARTACVAARCAYDLELRISNANSTAIDKAMNSKKAQGPDKLRVIHNLEARLDKSKDRLCASRVKLLEAECELRERIIMTVMAKLERREATLRAVRRRLRKRKISMLLPRSGLLRKAMV